MENVERGFGDKIFRVVARATMMMVKSSHDEKDFL